MEKAFFQNLTLSDTGRCFGYSAQQINRWVNEDGLEYVSTERGKKVFDSATVHRWLVERGIKKATTIQKRGRGSKSTKDPDGDDLLSGDPEIFDDNLDKYRHYKAEQAKLDLAKAKGKLISREEHEDFMRRCADFVRQGFQAKPRQLAAKLARMNEVSEIEDFLQSEIIAVLDRMSQLEMNDVT